MKGAVDREVSDEVDFVGRRLPLEKISPVLFVDREDSLEPLAVTRPRELVRRGSSPKPVVQPRCVHQVAAQILYAVDALRRVRHMTPECKPQVLARRKCPQRRKLGSRDRRLTTRRKIIRHKNTLASKFGSRAGKARSTAAAATPRTRRAR